MADAVENHCRKCGAFHKAICAVYVRDNASANGTLIRLTIRERSRSR
jgi:hypothetical protein